MDLELQGIIPRMLNDIFETVNFTDPERFAYTIRVSYIEVYMEKLRDLINTKIKKKLKIRQDKKAGMYVLHSIYSDLTMVTE